MISLFDFPSLTLPQQLQDYINRQMSEGLKSSLVVSQSSKKELPLLMTAPEVEYKQVGNKNDYIGELSDEEKEAEFNKQHEEYIKMKMHRKKELIKLKREEFGTSSSEERESSEEEEIGEGRAVRRIESKRSRGKIEGKAQMEPSSYPVVLQLKKLSVETELVFLEGEFQINKRTIPYSKIIKIHLFAIESEKGRCKLRIALNAEEFNMGYSDKQEGKDKSVQIFLKMLRMKLQSKEVKFCELQRKTGEEEYGKEQVEGAVAYDKLFKKSQIIGTWEERFVIIKPEGLYSYRSLKAKPTMFISLKEMKELQTQFEAYKELVVVKLIYNTTKTDFGLPVDQQLEWVRHFANLLTQ